MKVKRNIEVTFQRQEVEEAMKSKVVADFGAAPDGYEWEAHLDYMDAAIVELIEKEVVAEGPVTP